MDSAFQLGVDLIRRRDEVKQLLGQRYADELLVARAVLCGVANERKLGIAAAALAVGKQMAAAGVDPSIMVAALVEEAQARGGQ